MNRDPPSVVRETIAVSAPIAEAFRIFTERCHAWWPRSYRLGRAERIDVVIEPRASGRWYERTADGNECGWGTVLAWQPPVRLALSWQIGLGFVPEADATRASRVEVTFAESDPHATTVTVRHSELERHGKGWTAMADAISGERGWGGILRSYAKVVAGHGA